jgi:hypothetical protein
MLEPEMTVTTSCLNVVSLPVLTVAEDFGVWRELEDVDESGFAWTEDDDSVATGVGCEPTGLTASSLEQLRRRDAVPTKIKERRFFFMITKYSLQKGIDLAKTFLLSLKSL